LPVFRFFSTSPALFLLASCALLLPAGCPSRPKPGPGSLKDFTAAMREIEGLRSENRFLRKDLRDLSLSLDALRGEMEALRKGNGPAKEQDPARVRLLSEQVLHLQEELDRSRESAASIDPGPGPDGVARLFLEAIRKRDRKSIDALMDWNALVETAIRSTAETIQEGERAMNEYRAQSAGVRASQSERARRSFFTLAFGDQGPRLPYSALWNQPGRGILRYRASDEQAGMSWDVLIRRSGRAWKVVGLVRHEPLPVEPEAGEEDNEEDQDSR